MTFVGVLIAILIMGATVYMALDKKSTFQIRLVSLGSLALMLITIIICLSIALTDHRVPIDESVLIVGAPPPVKEENSGSMLILIVSIIFMLILFAVIFFLAMKEHRKSDKKPAAAKLGLK